MRGIRFTMMLARRGLPYIPGQPTQYDVLHALGDHVPGTRSPKTGERR